MSWVVPARVFSGGNPLALPSALLCSLLSRFAQGHNDLSCETLDPFDWPFEKCKMYIKNKERHGLPSHLVSNGTT